MGRWTDIDSDSQRLPEGFERIGYDADTQIYTFRGSDGKLYESESGNTYGELWPAGEPRPKRSPAEIEEHNEVIKKDNHEAMRMMLPFALLIFIFLILVFKLVDRGGSNGADKSGKQIIDCAQGGHQIQIHKGDTCWKIAEGHGLGIEDLLQLHGNEAVDCDRLRVGQAICVPV